MGSSIMLWVNRWFASGERPNLKRVWCTFPPLQSTLLCLLVSSQKKPETGMSMLHDLRQHLLVEMKKVLPSGRSVDDVIIVQESSDHDVIISESQVVEGSAIIRLYCALKGIASMRYTVKNLCRK